MTRNNFNPFLIKFTYKDHLPHPDSYHLGSRITLLGKIESSGENFYIIRSKIGKQLELIEYVKNYSKQRHTPVNTCIQCISFCFCCGKEMNPIEALNSRHNYCGKCTRKQHKETILI